MASAKITKSYVDRTEPSPKDQLHWDTELKGFGLKVTPAGIKTYIFQYRYPPGRLGKTCRINIGKHGSPWTAETARTEARALSGIVASGEDPRAARQKLKSGITVADLCDIYLRDGTGTKKASTLAIDRGRIEHHIKPLLGKMRVSDVKVADIRKFQNSVANGETKADIKTKSRGRAIVKGGEGAAARTVGLLGGIFSYAMELGLIEKNPVHGVKRFPDKHNERYVSPDEMKLLGELLSKSPPLPSIQTAKSIILLLILTGARRGEIQNLKWQEVDFDHSVLRLGDSKTGQKLIRLNAPAIAILQSHRENADDSDVYIFPAKHGKGPVTTTSQIWAKLRKGTPLADVRLHDLRHSYASLAVAQGNSLPIIGKLLGHASIATTQRYAHLADSHIAQTNEQIGTAISNVLGLSSEEPLP